MKDQYKARMFASFLNSHDSHRPEYSHILVNSVRSHINSKLGHERKTIEFITQLRQKLYFIHEYNCMVAKVTHEYPRSRKFDLLLIKYVELEFDILYKHGCPSAQLELTTELRVLRLLQVMLYPAVLNNQPLVSRNTDEVVKKAVLQLLGEVRSRYLLKNKLVCNIASKLLKKIDGNCKEFDFTSSRNISRNVATSDYGTDSSDSDIENEILFKKSQPSNSCISADKNSSDCVEVPLSSNGVTGIPTVEFVDDDNYLVYLEKQLPKKRKSKKDDCKAACKRKKDCLQVMHNAVSNKEEFSAVNCDTKNCNSGGLNIPTVLSKNVDTCVIICSDSEDESGDKPSSSSKVSETNEAVDKINGVVTFEIFDDDDDDTNYMVYLQKEVKTNHRGKKQKVVNTNEVIVCSDSEDDSGEKSVIVPPSPNTDENSVITNVQDYMSKSNATVPFKVAQCSVDKNDFDNRFDTNIKAEKCDETCSQNNFNISSDHLINHSEIKAEVQEVNESVGNTKTVNTSLQSATSDNLVGDHCVKEEVQEEIDLGESSLQTDITLNDFLRSPELKMEMTAVVEDTRNMLAINETEVDSCQLQTTSSSAAENNFINEELNVAVDTKRNTNTASTSVHGLGMVIAETRDAGCQVDPFVVFEENHLNKSELVLSSVNNVAQNHEMDISTSLDKEVQDKYAPGGPVLSERMEDLASVDSTLECRLNDTLLEEFLFEDTFTLEGRKEFEELEYFLFNDSVDKQGSYLSNFSFDDSETVLQPETFDADIKSLESFLDDSQLFSLTDRELHHAESNHDNLFEIHRPDLLESSKENASNNCNFLSNASVDQRSGSVPCKTQRDLQKRAKYSKKVKHR